MMLVKTPVQFHGQLRVKEPSDVSVKLAARKKAPREATHPR